eukprot:COSAG03_NODE_4882_length_1404_cov_159.567816_2_plen_78_part_00
MPRRLSHTDRHVSSLSQPAPHKDFSDLYEKMSGKGESAREAHLPFAGSEVAVDKGDGCSIAAQHHRDGALAAFGLSE